MNTPSSVKLSRLEKPKVMARKVTQRQSVLLLLQELMSLVLRLIILARRLLREGLKIRDCLSFSAAIARTARLLLVLQLRCKALLRL